MKKEKIEYFGLLDEKYVEEASPENAHRLRNMRKKRFKRIVALAACFCLIIGLSASLFNNLYRPQIPVYENALYSAEYIGSFFGGIGSYGTKEYQKIEVPSAEHLRSELHTIPALEYLPVYRVQKNTLPDKESFLGFATPIISHLSEEMGKDLSGYETIELTSAIQIKGMSMSDSFDCHMHAVQENGYNRFYIRGINPEGLFALGGVGLKLDAALSEEEIRASFEPMKQKLFEIFGAEFRDIKIHSTYDSTYAANNYVSVFLYNDSDNVLNKYSFFPVSDYIRVIYDVHNDAGDAYVSIEYRQMRAQTSVLTEAKRISLTDAEKLLYNGYVFGGYGCPLCMQEQDKVDFRGYDFVGITYLCGYDAHGNNSDYIPFYEFYKKIGVSKNGNIIYALTYVPAIEVSGYEEYFASLAKLHENE